MSPACISTPSALSMAALSGERTSATTLWPRPTNCLTISPPMNPVAPVTKYFAIPRAKLTYVRRSALARSTVRTACKPSIKIRDRDRRGARCPATGESAYPTDPSVGAALGRDRCVGHARGMADQRLHAAQAFAEGEESPAGHKVGHVVDACHRARTTPCRRSRSSAAAPPRDRDDLARPG